MKAHAHHGALPRAPVDPDRLAQHRRWRQRLLRAVGVLLAVGLVWGALALLHHAEGDLRQVQAPAGSSLDPGATRMS
ncbi:hypothetical protein [Roseateles amylovorans]|uniref:Uncharacterized protein n=1 Tax=Roseateles amylovorans TaxID=2978473 RepID=A0ABY6AZZ2_9BURK|nr:hypothetical protein [Roseateles amylovorans]UXH77979.1 hypothetical protein N4261_23975 [Roseateles amylovorans]